MIGAGGRSERQASGEIRAPRGHGAERTEPAMPPPRRLTPTRASLALRGLVAAVVLIAGLVGVVAYGNGVFAGDPHVTADVPAEAGLISGHVTVQYDGVPVGEVASIDAGTTRSLVDLRIDADAIDRIPAGVLVRVMPRTLFGDVFLQLVRDPDGQAARDDGRTAGSSTGNLRDGDRLRTDTSPDAVQLYDVYKEAVGLMDRLEPAKMQTALTAVADAMRGQGDELGRSIDRFAGAADRLVPVATDVLDHAPEMAAVAESARDATGDVLGMWRDTTALSQLVSGRPEGFADLMAEAGATTATVDAIAGEQSERLAGVIERSGPVLATTARGRAGLAATFDRLREFSAQGARVFQKGRFDITAVPGFAEPEPYTAAECPRYGGLAGSTCAGVSAEPERTGAGS